MLDLDKYKYNYVKDKNNVVRRRMLNKVPLIDLVTDSDTNLDVCFNIEVKTHGITNQESSGRCWAFSGLNILREIVIDKLNLDNFELSGSFVAFYDKLERYNILLERLIKYKKEDRDNYDRYLSTILEYGITDGGYFTQFANLVKKYGIVPKSVYPESFQSSNTYEVNQILSRLLRKFYLELDKSNDIDTLKDKYLDDAYKVVASVYGVPVDIFNFEYVDKDGKYHIDKDITPIDFYNKYIDINLDDYIEVCSYQDEKYKYNNIYMIEDTSRISGMRDNILLNLNNSDFYNLLIKQIKNKELIHFSAAVTSKRIDGFWIDTMDRYGDLFGLDLVLNKNDFIRSNGISGYHSMLITGVNIIDNKAINWKIENSWGEKGGKKGYWIASDDFVKKYVLKAVINKKYFTKKQLSYLEKEPIVIGKFEEKF